MGFQALHGGWWLSELRNDIHVSKSFDDAEIIVAGFLWCSSPACSRDKGLIMESGSLTQCEML
jgi:hypothetical protein